MLSALIRALRQREVKFALRMIGLASTFAEAYGGQDEFHL